MATPWSTRAARCGHRIRAAASAFLTACPADERACEAKQGDRCVAAGERRASAHEIDAAARLFTRACAEYYEKGCDGGQASGCVNLALRYRDGTGVPADPHRVEQLIERACSLGQRDACTH